MKKKWTPKDGERYWRVVGHPIYLTVMSNKWTEWCWPNNYNCFRTKREALAARKKIMEVLGG